MIGRVLCLLRRHAWYDSQWIRWKTGAKGVQRCARAGCDVFREFTATADV